jgi:hypothetical protein
MLRRILPTQSVAVLSRLGRSPWPFPSDASSAWWVSEAVNDLDDIRPPSQLLRAAPSRAEVTQVYLFLVRAARLIRRQAGVSSASRRHPFPNVPAVLRLDQHGQLPYPRSLRIHGAMRHTGCQRTQHQFPASGHRPKARGSLRWWALHEHHGKSRTNKLHTYLRLYYRTVLPMPPLWRW